MTVTDAALGVSLAALFAVTYKLGRRQKQAEQRARGFIEGWNAAVDASRTFAITGSHREAQLRAARGGWQ